MVVRKDYGTFSNWNYKSVRIPTSGADYWRDVAYGNGKYVAVGLITTADSNNNYGYITTSSDGENWTTPVAPSQEALGYLNSIIYDGSKFIICGDSRIGYSITGSSWTFNTVTYDPEGTNVKVTWDSIVYANNKYIAVGYNGSDSNSGYCATSTDGVNWSVTKIANTQLNTIIYANGKYIVTGNNTILYSVNGTTWTNCSGTYVTLRYWHGVTYGNGKYVAVSYNNNYVSISTDGINWTSQYCSMVPNSCESISFNKGKFVTTGRFGGNVVVSEDGINWTTTNVNTDDCRFVRSVNGRIMLPGGSGIIISELKTSIPYLLTTKSGNTEKRYMLVRKSNSWNSIPNKPSTTTWTKVVYGNGIYVMLGNNSYITKSSDLVNWSTPIQIPSASGFVDIDFGDGKFVAVGNNKVGYSTDGVNWTTQSSNKWSKIQFVNHRWFAGGNDTGLIPGVSTDGINWTMSNSDCAMSTRIVYGNGVYVSFSDIYNRYLVYSNDGINWTQSGFDPSWMHNDIAFGNGKFVVGGQYDTGRYTYAGIRYSTDGINWRTQAYEIQNDMFSTIFFCENEFLAELYKSANRKSSDGINWTIDSSIKVPDKNNGNKLFQYNSYSNLLVSDRDLKFYM